MFNFGNFFFLIHPFMIFEGCLNSNLRVMPHSTLWATQHPTEPSGTLLSYADPPELPCTLLTYPAPSELGCTVLYPTVLRWTILSYASPYWAATHPSELQSTLWSTLLLLGNDASYWASLLRCIPSELFCTLLSFVASFWATKPSELGCILLSNAVRYWATHPTVLRCTRLSYAAPFSALLHPSELQRTLWPTLHPTVQCTMLHPSELHRSLLSDTAPSDLSCTPRAEFHPSEFPFNLRAMLYPTELRCTQLIYAGPYCATVLCTILSNYVPSKIKKCMLLRS